MGLVGLITNQSWPGLGVVTTNICQREHRVHLIDDIIGYIVRDRRLTFSSFLSVDGLPPLPKSPVVVEMMLASCPLLFSSSL